MNGQTPKIDATDRGATNTKWSRKLYQTFLKHPRQRSFVTFRKLIFYGEELLSHAQPLVGRPPPVDSRRLLIRFIQLQ
jgi:hypothetical protein